MRKQTQRFWKHGNVYEYVHSRTWDGEQMLTYKLFGANRIRPQGFLQGWPSGCVVTSSYRTHWLRWEIAEGIAGNLGSWNHEKLANLEEGCWAQPHESSNRRMMLESCVSLSVGMSFNSSLKIPLSHLNILQRASDTVLLNISNWNILALTSELMSYTSSYFCEA